MRLSILLTFLASFASILVERGIFFLARETLGFSDARNLWLALLFGGTYVAGAAGSHSLARRLGERRTLALSLVGHVAVLGAMALRCTPFTVFAGLGLMGALSGIKWPIVETYVTAGSTPREAFGAVGRFNMAWGFAVPTAMALEGWLIHVYPPATFLVAGGLCVLALAICRTFPPRPTYLDADHPERPDARGLARQTALLALSRWLMLMGYICLWIMMPLAPGIFARLGVRTTLATALAGTLDWTRLAAFAVLYLGMWWQGRRCPLVASMLALPVGFAMFLLGSDLVTALGGLVIVGVAVGVTYYAALYYAMVVKNASVAAGGGHETFIGLGFVLGPIAGLLAETITGATSSKALGMALGIGPFILFCCAAGLVALVRRWPGR